MKGKEKENSSRRVEGNVNQDNGRRKDLMRCIE